MYYMLGDIVISLHVALGCGDRFDRLLAWYEFWASSSLFAVIEIIFLLATVTKSLLEQDVCNSWKSPGI